MTAGHPTPLTLRLAHDPAAIKPADDIPEGWQADTYVLTAARAAGVPETEVVLPEEALLELMERIEQAAVDG